VGSEPLWAWVCSFLDGQDAINELFKCVLAQSDRIAFEGEFNEIPLMIPCQLCYGIRRSRIIFRVEPKDPIRENGIDAPL